MAAIAWYPQTDVRLYARLPLPGGGIWQCPGEIIRVRGDRCVFRTLDGTLHTLDRDRVTA